MSKTYSFENQHDDEEILYVFRHHSVTMRRGLIGLLAMMILGFTPITIWPTNSDLLWLALVGLLIGALHMFYEWIAWYYSIYIITDQRFVQIKQKGLFNRSIVGVGLNKIQNVNSQIAGIQQTVLGFGTIVIQTFVGDLVLEKIRHPQEIQTRLTKVIKQHGHQEAQETEGQEAHASQEE